MEMTIIIDHASLEMFADDGLTVMTAVSFPNEIYSEVHISSPENLQIKTVQFNRLKGIWK